MRIAVTGRAGQIVRALAERVPADVTVIPLGRPDLDLERLETIAPAMVASRPDIVVNAAAFTAVDLAESREETAQRVNGDAAGAIAAVADSLGVPIIQISTDYVFDGSLGRPYREDDATGPLCAYGRSKLAGELAVARSTQNHAILRTSWVYSPFGSNFVRSMIRLGSERREIGVVADQAGCPTSALDLADAIIALARDLVARPHDMALRGVFHMAAKGEAVWADVAEAVFADCALAGHAAVAVRRIATRDYPTPARRPANSRLDTGKLATIYGISLPDWRESLAACVARLISAPSGERTP